MSPSKSLKKNVFLKFFLLAHSQNIFKFQIIKIFGKPQKFLKGQNAKGQIQRSKQFPQMSNVLKVKVFLFFAVFLFWGEPKFHRVCPIFGCFFKKIF